MYEAPEPFLGLQYSPNWSWNSPVLGIQFSKKTVTALYPGRNAIICYLKPILILLHIKNEASQLPLSKKKLYRSYY
jgi:hypothetical protein